MKKMRLMSLLLVAMLICSVLPSIAVAASNSYKKPTKIKSGYSVDLNGDKKKEKITISSVRLNSHPMYGTKVTVKVGNKSIPTKFYDAKIYVGDINKKDKYKEVFIISNGGDMECCYVYRYNGSSLKRINASYTDLGKKYSNRSYINCYSNKAIRLFGDGRISLYSPNQSRYVEYKLNGSKLNEVYVKPKLLKSSSILILNANHDYTPEYEFYIEFKTYGLKGNVYVDVYDGVQKIYNDKCNLDDLFGIESGFASGIFVIADENWNPLIESGKQYTVKVYIKTSAGTSNIISEEYTIK